MKISQLISEGLSPILFHRTNLYAGSKIMTENRFRLVSPMGTRVEQELTKKAFYLSTSRSLSGYYDRNNKSYSCYFVLDGSKLMNNGFSGEPINYWDGFPRGERDELEDRVWSNSPNIKPATKYILEVNILFNDKPYDGDYEETQKITIVSIIKECKKNKIPVYLYTDQNAYNTRNKKKTVTDFTILKRNRDFKVTKSSEMKRINFLAPYIELIKVPAGSKLSDGAKYLKNKIVGYKWYRDEHVRSLEADIHNTKTNDKTNEFVQLCRSMKFFTAADVIDYIDAKFTKS